MIAGCRGRSWAWPAAIATVVFPAYAHDPITTKVTWTQEVSRIFFKKCAGCHREGGSAPMALMTYEEARPWAKAIRDEVLERRMPPWGPVKGVGDFRDDASLSQPEIDLLVSWVEGGAPKGEDMYLPPGPPAPQAKLTAPNGEAVIVAPTRVLTAPHHLLAIRPRGVSEHGTFELAAIRPDGAVERLIWIRDFRASQNRTYVLREALLVPAGTRLAVYSSPAASAEVTCGRAQRKQ